jgi:hypothetical protein
MEKRGALLGGKERARRLDKKKGNKENGSRQSAESRRMFLLLPPRPLPQLPQVINYRNVRPLRCSSNSLDLFPPLGRPDQPVEEEGKKVEMKERRNRFPTPRAV